MFGGWWIIQIEGSQEARVFAQCGREKLMSRIPAITLAVFVVLPIIEIICISPHAAAAQPDLTLYKTASPGIVSPGDSVTYRMWFHNLGPQDSPQVWINDTLPPEVSYVNDTAYLHYTSGTGFFEYSILAGNVLHIKFNDVPVGNHSYVVYVRVGNSVVDGQVLTNRAQMTYLSGSNRIQPQANATASVAVSTPVMQLGKVIVPNPSDPTRVNFTLTVGNAGSANSMFVWVNDSLPTGIVYQSYQAPPGVACTEGPPNRVSCSTTNFAPGSQTWEIAARVTSQVPPDIPIVNWVFMNATDQDGSLLPEIAASASFTSQSASVIVAKLVDQMRAMPGSNIHYFIYYNNSGPLAAGHVWINDTLPSGVSVVSASPAPIYNSSGRINWYFADVPVGPHAVNIEVALATNLGNGIVLTNQVSLDFFDQIGRKKPRSVANASTTVTFDIPSIDLVKTANVQKVQPGGNIEYKIYYNNTGSATAQTVSIEDTLPAGVQITAANPGYTSFSGNRYFWTLQNVPPGSHEISLTIRVDQGVADGTTLTNTATVTYTDMFGQTVGSNFMSVIVSVESNTQPPPNGNDPVQDNTMFLLALAAIVAVALVIAIWMFMSRRGKDAVIDDVFLLHKDGLLIRHFTRKLNPEVDSDILGGMLIAVQNFVNESFASDKGLAREGGLDELKFGEYSILIARGKFVVMAAVVLGGNTENTVKEIKASIKDLEDNLGSVLDKWSGDMGQVEDADQYMQDLMAGKYRRKVRAQ